MGKISKLPVLFREYRLAGHPEPHHLSGVGAPKEVAANGGITLGPRTRVSSRFESEMILAKQKWVIGRGADIGVFFATPLLLIPASFFFLNGAIFPIFKLAILGISSTGHHLPGIIRAYTDKAIFNQFRWRLILVPGLFVLLTAACAVFKLNFTFFVLILWSIWHGSMQILGFLRIYDAKAGFQSPLTARLDFWMCLTWFVQVILWSPSRSTSVFSSFYLAGGPLLPLPVFQAAQSAWLWLTMAVTVAFLGNALINGIKLKYWNPPKFLLMGVSIGFWAYCMVGAGSLIVGLIMWEIFHDLQYNVFVWKYNQTRVAKNLSQSPLERFLFHPSAGRIAFYALCIAAYGCLGLFSQDLANMYQNQGTYGSLVFQIGNVFAASALIHFYLDGFIWKVRDGKVLQDLGVASQAGFRNRSTPFHAGLLAFFFIGAAAMAYSEYHWNRIPGGRGKPDNLADLVPRSGYANFMKATRLRAEGKADSAVDFFERAIRYDSAYEFSRAFLGELKQQTGDYPAAIAHYAKALETAPEDLALRENLAGLYLKTGAYPEAFTQYQSLSVREPGNAGYAYQAGFSLLQMKKGLSAKPFLEASLRLSPDQPDALNYLGMIEQAMGNPDSARKLYGKALLLDSTHKQARSNLAGLPAD